MVADNYDNEVPIARLLIGALIIATSEDLIELLQISMKVERS